MSMTHRMGRFGSCFLAGACIAGLPVTGGLAKDLPPVLIARQGAFEAGGTVLRDGDRSLSCDHGYVEYEIPAKAHKMSMLMWHSSSTKVWQTRWDGGEGFQSIFLRRGFPVYLWDGPRVGRANWGCATYSYKPLAGRDEQNFVSWRLGTKYPDWFPGVQFPTNDPEAWNQATRARYDEFDTVENAQLESDAAAKAVDRIGPTVLVTNSAGGFRALLTAVKSDNVKAIIAYENPGYVLPEGTILKAGLGRFPPAYVTPEQFRRLARIPIQLVFGDNVAASESWTAYRENARQFIALINAQGGHAELLDLPSVGLKGNTHIAFADLNNVAVADQLSKYLRKNKLDR